MRSVLCWAEWSEKESGNILLILGVYLVEATRQKVKELEKNVYLKINSFIKRSWLRVR